MNRLFRKDEVLHKRPINIWRKRATSLAISKMQMKDELRFHLTPVEMAVTKKASGLLIVELAQIAFYLNSLADRLLPPAEADTWLHYSHRAAVLWPLPRAGRILQGTDMSRTAIWAPAWTCALGGLGWSFHSCALSMAIRWTRSSWWAGSDRRCPLREGQAEFYALHCYVYKTFTSWLCF